MKYMTDAMLAGLAKELQSYGIDCETVHKLLRDTDDTRIKIEDPDIIQFLRGKDKSITLITIDTLLTKYCKIDEIPHIRVQDLVIEHIRKTLGN